MHLGKIFANCYTTFKALYGELPRWGGLHPRPCIAKSQASRLVYMCMCACVQWCVGVWLLWCVCMCVRMCARGCVCVWWCVRACLCVCVCARGVCVCVCQTLCLWLCTRAHRAYGLCASPLQSQIASLQCKQPIIGKSGTRIPGEQPFFSDQAPFDLLQISGSPIAILISLKHSSKHQSDVWIRVSAITITLIAPPYVL